MFDGIFITNLGMMHAQLVISSHFYIKLYGGFDQKRVKRSNMYATTIEVTGHFGYMYICINKHFVCSLEPRSRNLSGHSHTETPSSMSSVSEVDELMTALELGERVGSIILHWFIFDYNIIVKS